MSKTLIDLVTWERVPVGAGAAAGHIDLRIGSVNGPANGPTALITAGIHGDEGPWGGWAIRRLLEQSAPEELLGALRIVPMANPLALEADARNAPLDLLDLNRVFPGDANGSHTERLAAALVARAVQGAAVVIDLHGGGSWCVNAFVFRFPGGEALAEAIRAPFLVAGPDRSVTLTGYARTQGAAVMAVEMGGRSAHEAAWAERIARGLRRALAAVGVMTPPAEDAPSEPPEPPSIPVGPTQVLRPSRGGLFRPLVGAERVGSLVPGGTPLGALLDPVTYDTIEVFRAPYAQTALLLLRPMLARIEGGAMTYVVAEPTP